MFQFQCPQGHLLQGDESQAGQTINCPVCQMLFIIPAPIGAAPAPQPEPPAPQVQVGSGGPATPAVDPMAPPPPPELLHIPCPAGHILDTPLDMLDQEVLCPKCGVQFRLREKDSVEFKQKKAEQEEVRMAKLGKAWLTYSIVAVVLVMLLLVGLILLQANS